MYIYCKKDAVPVIFGEISVDRCIRQWLAEWLGPLAAARATRVRPGRHGLEIGHRFPLTFICPFLSALILLNGNGPELNPLSILLLSLLLWGTDNPIGCSLHGTSNFCLGWFCRQKWSPIIALCFALFMGFCQRKVDIIGYWIFKYRH